MFLSRNGNWHGQFIASIAPDRILLTFMHFFIFLSAEQHRLSSAAGVLPASHFGSEPFVRGDLTGDRTEDVMDFSMG
jgi:hypothetical protein